MNKQSSSQLLEIDHQVTTPSKDIYSHGRLIAKTKGKDMATKF